MKNKLFSKIKEIAKKDGVHFNRTFLIEAAKELISRVSKNTDLKEALIFKGGILLKILYGSNRYTKDIDATFMNISPDRLKAKVEEVLLTQDLDNAFKFAIKSWSEINENADYKGLRVTLNILFDEKVITNTHFDLTFGHVEKEGFSNVSFEEKGIKFKAFVKEQIVAEKLSALVSKKENNTRVKDLFDIVHLTHEGLDYETLKSLIKKTFQQRSIELPKSFLNFYQNDVFKESLESAWATVANENKDYGSFKDLSNAFEKSLKEIDSRAFKISGNKNV